MQRKFENAEEFVDAQQDYIKEFSISYKNPFGYPEVLKDKNGNAYYDVFNENYQPFSSQIHDIIAYRNENKISTSEAEKQELIKKEQDIINRIKTSAKKLGLYSGRLYWNHSNKEIIEAVKYSPDFDPNAEETVVMLKNPEYSTKLHTEEELKNIPQRIATRIRKYLYSDPRQKYNDEFKKLMEEAALKLKNNLAVEYSLENEQVYNEAVNKLYKENTVENDFVNGLNAKHYRENRLFALDEYSLRVEYQSFQPTSLSNALSDLSSNLVPINRKFVELNGGITDFGLDLKRFLTNGAFNIEDLELGPQGYVRLVKNVQYYSSDKTSSNTIKILFSSDQNINSTLYDDQLIAATRIPAIQQLNY
ncbi:UNVERIFIED_CONTAM: hypothetical protein O8I53_06180 [Campylobacter lari]